MTIQQIYNSYYKHIDREIFNAAVAADPTSYNQEKIVKVGNFVKWILKLYTNGSWKPGDSYETRDLLSKFIKYKSKLPVEKRDINRYNSIYELYSLIQTLEGQGVKSQKDIKKEGAEVVYEDSEWKIVIPHTEEASCIYGANTKWCTAGREHNMFDYYNKKGPLYININKQNGDKYQFHYETNSFMDAEDKRISPREIGLSEGVMGYYKSIGKEPYFIYDKVGIFSDGIACVKKGGKGWNLINSKRELLWDKYKNYDDVYNFYNGFASVKIEGKGYNYINPQGELLWKGDNWFELVGNFHEGFACVKIEGKGYNFINTQGELLWSEYENFDAVGIFSEGLAWVKIEGKGYNYINPQGELLWKGDKWFDGVDSFGNGFARVYIESRGWNLINTKGELVYKGDKWFDYVYIFSEGFAEVKIKGKGFNFINSQGELLWKGDKWFDDVGKFCEGFAWVQIKGKGWNFINKQGELVWKGDKWFDCFNYSDNALAKVKLEGKWYKLNSKGELVN